MKAIAVESTNIIKFPKRVNDRFYYTDKKTKKRKKLSDNITRDLTCVTRSNDQSRRLAFKVRTLATNLYNMILKNPYKEIFVDHKFLSQITEVLNKQNSRILAQLADIFSCQYHNVINFQGKIMTYGYVINFTEDGQKRIENPELFYSMELWSKRKIIHSSGSQKLSPENPKMSPPEVVKNDHPGGQKLPPYTKENKEEEEENNSKSYFSSSLSNTSITESVTETHLLSSKPRIRVKAISEKIVVAHSSDLTCAPGGASSHSECLSKDTNGSTLITAEDEREHYRNHRNRRPVSDNNIEFAPITKTIQKVMGDPNELPLTSESTIYRDPEMHEMIKDIQQQKDPWRNILRRAEEDKMTAEDPRTDTIIQLDKEQKQDVITRQFGKISVETDLENKLIKIKRPSEYWEPWFDLNFREKFEQYFAAEGFSFSII